MMRPPPAAFIKRLHGLAEEENESAGSQLASDIGNLPRVTFRDRLAPIRALKVDKDVDSAGYGLPHAARGPAAAVGVGQVRLQTGECESSASNIF